MKKILTFLLLVCPFMHAWAYDKWTDENGVTWEFVGDGYTYATLYGCSQTEGDIVVPTTVDIDNGWKTYTINAIANRAFQNSQVTSITIPENVIKIGTSAFEGCTNLKSVNIPEGVTKIENYTFEKCSSLESITLPAGITSIGDAAFKECTSLKSIVIPNQVKSISDNCFSYCTNLEDVTFPESLTSIEYQAFYECKSLKEAQLPEGVNNIGYNAFQNCRGMKSVNIPAGVKNIKDCVFQGCSGLTNVTLNEGLETIGKLAFYGCASLPTITIPSTVTSMGEAAFFGCDSLTDVHIKDIAKWCAISIDGDSANPLFMKSEEGVKNLYVNDELVTDLVIPDGVTSISANAFARCTSITSVTLPEGFKNVGERAFYICQGITNVSFPEGLESIGNSSFYKNNLTSVEIPASVACIDAFAFYVNANLSEVILHEGLQKIGEEAFRLTNLTTVSIPSTVTQIDKMGLGEQVTTIYCYAMTPPTIMNNTFNNYSITGTLYVPYDTLDAYKSEYYYWRLFDNIEEMAPEEWTFDFDTPIITYCSKWDLDFTGTYEVKAYIANGFNPETGRVILTRIEEVPAGTGLILRKDNPGEVTVPVRYTDMYVTNLLVGVTEDTEISSVMDDKYNFVLANGDNGVGFYPASSGTLAAGKAYLALPIWVMENNANAITLQFEDEETTGISQLTDDSEDQQNQTWYTLDGRRLNGQPTQKGIYMVKGKKVMVK